MATSKAAKPKAKRPAPKAASDWYTTVGMGVLIHALQHVSRRASQLDAENDALVVANARQRVLIDELERSESSWHRSYDELQATRVTWRGFLKAWWEGRNG